MGIRRTAFWITHASLAAVAWAGVGQQAQAGMVSYAINADTTSLLGSPGRLEFEFNPIGTPASATASVFNYQQTADTVLSGTSSTSGDASGVLPGPLSFDNATPKNDLSQGLTFGTALSFDLTVNWAGPALDGTSKTVFTFFLEDKSGAGVNLGPANEAFDLYVNPDGSSSDTVYPNDANHFDVTVRQLSVPEPSSIVLVAIGVVGFLARTRLRKPSGRKTT
jgi:hypothetical protein